MSISTPPTIFQKAATAFSKIQWFNFASNRTEMFQKYHTRFHRLEQHQLWIHNQFVGVGEPYSDVFHPKLTHFLIVYSSNYDRVKSSFLRNLTTCKKLLKPFNSYFFSISSLIHIHCQSSSGDLGINSRKAYFTINEILVRTQSCEIHFHPLYSSYTCLPLFELRQIRFPFKHRLKPFLFLLVVPSAVKGNTLSDVPNIFFRRFIPCTAVESTPNYVTGGWACQHQARMELLFPDRGQLIIHGLSFFEKDSNTLEAFW